MCVSADHWLSGARRLPSPNADDRPDPQDISLIVIHGISLPPGEFGAGLIEALFTNRLSVDPAGPMADLAGLRVSSHLVIDRAGGCAQFVAFDRRAWHAGVSIWQGRPGCNDHAIGIELEGADTVAYTDAQYQRLASVLRCLIEAYPRLSRESLVGHSEVSPGRKTDPGQSFDWRRLLLALW